jgi:hypothetical protein
MICATRLFLAHSEIGVAEYLDRGESCPSL